MAKKIQLQDANGNVLHPLTLGECVAMDNGENLDTLMSKSQMFTPTITQDKSMFKVGTGVDVDYSANVKDGAYESLVFKGKSLVNLATQSVNYGLAKHSNITSGKITVNVQASKEIKFTVVQEFSEWIYITVKINLDMLKPNTKYLVVGESIKNISYARICRGDTTHNLEQTPYPYFGNSNYVVLTTNDLTNYVHNDITLYLRPKVNLSVGSEVHVKNVMLIEYQEDMENRGIPYFEGLCDSKMPILHNVGKNLFNTEDVFTRHSQVANLFITQNSIEYTSNGQYASVTNEAIRLKKGEKYSFSADVKGCRLFFREVVNGETKYYVLNKDDATSYEHATITFTPQTNTCAFEMNSASTEQRNIGAKNIQLEESSSTTTYEDHKTNILRTSEEIVLREVGGVCDTYNPLTGEYVKRIGEIILNGTEKWGNFRDETDTTWRTSFSLPDAKPSSVCICNKFIHSKGATEEKVKVYITVTPNLSITVLKSEFPTLEVFKTWLSQNPVTIQYELAEPVTSVIKPSTMTPFAYQNGHAIVESGFEGQSLLPEIEYSVVTGRTGQVTQNTKVLRQQEQQIIGLEELLLTQVVQMEYERTLLQFDYELQMMKLG